MSLIGLILLVASSPVALGNSIGKSSNSLPNEPVKILQKIVGGTPAVDGQLPYQVQLQINAGTTGYLCGGTLVSSTIVVSAAHCFYGLGVTSGTVYAGSVRMNGGSGTGQYSEMASYWIHPQFSETTMYNDLSIITLSTPFTFNSYVAPMPLAASNATFATGLTCTVSGWGTTTSGGSISNTLMYASVSIVSQTTCANTWTSLPSTGICTSTTTTDTCQGDSGGPVICSGTARDGTTTNVLAGIVSYGSECATGIPAVNTRVSSYSDLIYNFISSVPSTTTTSTTTRTITTIKPRTTSAAFNLCSCSQIIALMLVFTCLVISPILTVY